MAWVHGADHGHAVRNLVAAMCFGGVSNVTGSAGEVDVYLIPTPLDEARLLEQTVARKAGHKIILGQCKGSLPSTGLVVDAASGIRVLRWGCVVLIGKYNDELCRWEADAIHPASE